MFDPTLADPPAARRRSPETWDRIRADYLDGAPAPALCERYDVGLTALRTRARAEGWRRTDAPDPEPEDDALDAEPLSPAELADLAWRRLSAAVRHGRLKEAQGWERLHRSFRKLSEAEAAQPVRPPPPGEVAAQRPEGAGPHEASPTSPLRHAAAPRATSPGRGGPDTHDPHDPHAVPASALANRAARRALAKRRKRTG